MSTAIELWAKGDQEPFTLIVPASGQDVYRAVAEIVVYFSIPRVFAVDKLRETWPDLTYVDRLVRGGMEEVIVVDTVSFRVKRSGNWRSLSWRRWVKKYGRAA